MTFVASLGVLFDIASECRPPEAVEDGSKCGEVSFVAEFVMCVVEDGAVLWGEEHELVPALCLSSPKAFVMHKELLCSLGKLLAFIEGDVEEVDGVGEDGMDAFEFFFAG